MQICVKDMDVAPLMGAWIEITALLWLLWYSLSLPSWERGLKFSVVMRGQWVSVSLPSWERGLKCLYQKVVSHEAGRSPRGSVD